MEAKGKAIPIKKITRFGYEYTLVLAPLRDACQELPEPCFMGFKGYALQSVKKIKQSKHSKK
jgi:hypothetical protein